VWPIAQLRRRKRKRSYHAALVVSLGVWMYGRLAAADKARVHSEIVKMERNLWNWPLVSAGGGTTSWDVVSAVRAVAMARLKLEPAGIGLSWRELLSPWRRSFVPGFERRPYDVLADFRPFHEVTREAEAFLRERGVDVPDQYPYEQGYIDDFGGIGGIREYLEWRRKNAS